MAEESGAFIGVVAGPPLPEAALQPLWSATQEVLRARKTLDPEPILALLAADAVHEAQHILEPLRGRQAIGRYLVDRFDYLRRHLKDRQDLSLSLGVVDLPAATDHPCIVLAEGTEAVALWVIRLNAAREIARFDILTVAPHPSSARVVTPP